MGKFDLTLDQRPSKRLIRAVRSERGATYGRVWVEERYKPGEPYQAVKYDCSIAEVSIVTVWRWRLVYVGPADKSGIAAEQWIKTMREHPDAEAYAAQFR